jgi:hypothetical protein
MFLSPPHIKHRRWRPHHHRVIAFDNRGVGRSEGETSNDVHAMAHDAEAFIIGSACWGGSAQITRIAAGATVLTVSTPLSEVNSKYRTKY